MAKDNIGEMKLERVQTDDDFKALKFYNEVQSDRATGLITQRRAPFTAKYQCISRDFDLFQMLSENDETHGLAAMAYLDCRFGEDYYPCVIGSDLKIMRNRKAVLEWPQFFVEQLKRLKQERGIKYVFSAVSTHERQAYNTFIRPRSVRRNLPRYYLYRRFDLINIHGFLPFSAKALDSIKITSADSRSFEQLTDYIFKSSISRPLCPYKTEIDVADQIIRWPNYEQEKFLIARDHRGKIVGCLGLWNPTSLFQFHISSPSAETIYLHRLLKFSQLLGWGRSLSLKMNLNPVMITHLNFDHPDVFSSLLRVAWEHISNSEFLSYIHFKTDLAAKPPKMMIKTTIPYALYLVQLQDDGIPEIWPASSDDPAPVFEIPYI